MKNKLILVALIALFCYIAAGCAQATPAPTSTEPPTEIPVQASLTPATTKTPTATLDLVQALPGDKPYMGQTLPGEEPVVFAPSIISKPGRVEERLSFSNDGKWLFYMDRDDAYTEGSIMYMHLENSSWEGPKKAEFFDELTKGWNPCFSADGEKIIFDSGERESNFYRPVVMEKIDANWGKPTALEIPIAIKYLAVEPTMIDDGTIYFLNGLDSNGRMFDVYRSRYVEGKYLDAERILQRTGDGLYVSRDNSFIIYNVWATDRLVFWISFNNMDGSWTEGKDLGSKINGEGNQTMPVLSSDNRYLFFTRWVGSTADIYWVRVDELIESLK